MLHHVKIHCEEPGLQCSTERVPLHQANLRVGRLVSEQVLLRWDHILEDLDRQGGSNTKQLSLEKQIPLITTAENNYQFENHKRRKVIMDVS